MLKEMFRGTFSIKGFVDAYNSAIAGVVVFLTAIFGPQWYVFAFFLILNVFDFFTGWWKAHKLKIESSAAGLRGFIKKLLYWVLIAVAFIFPFVLIALGRDVLGFDLSFLLYFGWFAVATLTINEARSVLENLVELGVNVPAFLIKGLAVTQKMIDKKVEAALPVDETKTE